eukprot:Rhum_TRINITY_DN25278_c0_g1::Rhum_TRINITY_DN25278_c0_g1_i1::g.181700::m.181700
MQRTSSHPPFPPTHLISFASPPPPPPRPRSAPRSCDRGIVCEEIKHSFIEVFFIPPSFLLFFWLFFSSLTLVHVTEVHPRTTTHIFFSPAPRLPHPVHTNLSFVRFFFSSFFGPPHHAPPSCSSFGSAQQTPTHHMRVCASFGKGLTESSTAPLELVAVRVLVKGRDVPVDKGVLQAEGSLVVLVSSRDLTERNIGVAPRDEGVVHPRVRVVLDDRRQHGDGTLVVADQRARLTELDADPVTHVVGERRGQALLHAEHVVDARLRARRRLDARQLLLDRPPVVLLQRRDLAAGVLVEEPGVLERARRRPGAHVHRGVVDDVVDEPQRADLNGQLQGHQHLQLLGRQRRVALREQRLHRRLNPLHKRVQHAQLRVAEVRLVLVVHVVRQRRQRRLVDDVLLRLAAARRSLLPRQGLRALQRAERAGVAAEVQVLAVGGGHLPVVRAQLDELGEEFRRLCEEGRLVDRLHVLVDRADVRGLHQLVHGADDAGGEGARVEVAVGGGGGGQGGAGRRVVADLHERAGAAEGGGGVRGRERVEDGDEAVGLLQGELLDGPQLDEAGRVAVTVPEALVEGGGLGDAETLDRGGEAVLVGDLAGRPREGGAGCRPGHGPGDLHRLCFFFSLLFFEPTVKSKAQRCAGSPMKYRYCSFY